MNFQSTAIVRGIQGLPLLWFMAARALVMIGSSFDEDIFFARVTSMAQM